MGFLKNLIRLVDQVTNKDLNDPAQTRPGHRVTTLTPPPPSPLHRFLAAMASRLMDGRSEGSLRVGNSTRHWTRKGIRSRRRRM